MSRSRVLIYLTFLAVLVNLANLLPVLESPFLGDDAWRESVVRGVASLTNTGLGEISWNVSKDFIRDGRWYPLVVYYYTVFYYLDRFSYKAVEIGLVLVNIALLAYLVQLVTRRKSFSLITLLVAPLFIQFRFYHDPILSYYYLMQIEFLLLGLSLIFFIWFLRKKRRINLGLSIILFTAALLVYEAFYAFFALYGLVAYTELGWNQKKLVVKTSAPFLLVTLVNIGLIFLIRTYFHTSYEGATVSLAFWPWLTAFSKQAFAAIPLSYVSLFGNPDQILGYVKEAFFSQILMIVCLWMILWCFSWDYINRSDEPVDMKRFRNISILGIGFWLLPAFIVTLSAKYQRELKWGLGYLPVYVSGFGLLMVLLTPLALMCDFLKRSKRFYRFSTVIATGLAGGLLIGVNFINNSIVVRGYNEAEHYHRSVMEEALEYGLMKGLDDGAYIVLGPPVRSWDQPAFFRMRSGLTLQVVKPPGFDMDRLLGAISYEDAFENYLSPSCPPITYDFTRLTAPREKFAGYSAEFEGTQGVVVRRKLKPNADAFLPSVYLVKYEATAKDLGYAALAHLTKLQTSADSKIRTVADSIRIYIALPSGKIYNEILISGNWMDPDSLKQTGAFVFKDKDLNLVASFEKGKILEFPSNLINRGIDAKSIAVTLTVIEN